MVRNLAKNISAIVWGEEKTCFQQLFLYSIWVMRLHISIINMGNKNADKTFHPWIKCIRQGSDFRAGIKCSGLKVYVRRKINGINAAPSKLSQKAELRFALMASERIEIARLTDDCLLCQ